MARGTRIFGAGETQERGTEGDTTGSPPPVMDTDTDTDPKGNGAAAPAEDGKTKKSDERKTADFSRLASSRATDALKAMMLLGHLANPSQYLWTEEQETKLFDTLSDKITELRKQFAASRAPQEGKKRPKQLLVSI